MCNCQLRISFYTSLDIFNYLIPDVADGSPVSTVKSAAIRDCSEAPTLYPSFFMSLVTTLNLTVMEPCDLTRVTNYQN